MQAWATHPPAVLARQFSVSGSQFSVLKSRFSATCSGNRKPETGNRKEAQAQIRQNWKNIRKELDFLAHYASKDKLAEAITLFSEGRKSRFLRRRTPKYGSMNKGFTGEELQKFFSIVSDARMHLLFSYQAVLGLRIGEAVRVHIKDINLKTRELKIETEKAKTLDFLIIPEQLFDATLSYIRNFETEITNAGGYLFFAQNRHLSISYARQEFNKYIKKAKLYETYGFSNDAKPRTLTRLTTHSLRHYAITKDPGCARASFCCWWSATPGLAVLSALALQPLSSALMQTRGFSPGSLTNHSRKNNGNVVLVNKFARHRRLQTTMVYIYTNKEELYRSIERAQDTELLNRIKRMQEGG